MLIYAAKYELEKRIQFFISKKIEVLLNPRYWHGVTILEIVMFKVPDNFILKNYKCVTLEKLCQGMIASQS